MTHDHHWGDHRDADPAAMRAHMAEQALEKREMVVARRVSELHHDRLFRRNDVEALTSRAAGVNDLAGAEIRAHVPAETVVWIGSGTGEALRQ